MTEESPSLRSGRFRRRNCIAERKRLCPKHEPHGAESADNYALAQSSPITVARPGCCRSGPGVCPKVNPCGIGRLGRGYLASYDIRSGPRLQDLGWGIDRESVKESGEIPPACSIGRQLGRVREKKYESRNLAPAILLMGQCRPYKTSNRDRRAYGPCGGNPSTCCLSDIRKSNSTCSQPSVDETAPVRLNSLVSGNAAAVTRRRFSPSARTKPSTMIPPGSLISKYIRGTILQG